MQQYGRLVIKNSVLDSLVCSGDSLILETASPRTHKPKIVNESLYEAENLVQRRGGNTVFEISQRTQLVQRAT